jgi:hypothetical protein
VTKIQTFSVVLTMIVSYALTLAITTWQNSVSAPPAAQVAAVDAAPLALLPPQPAMRPIRQPVVAPVGAPAAAPAIRATANDEPPAEPLPVSVHLFNRHGQHRIELVIANTSNSALDITVRVEAGGEHQASETSIRLEPGQQRSFGDADGIQMQAGDRVMLHNAQFHDWVGEVPP